MRLERGRGDNLVFVFHLCLLHFPVDGNCLIAQVHHLDSLLARVNEYITAVTVVFVSTDRDGVPTFGQFCTETTVVGCHAFSNGTSGCRVCHFHIRSFQVRSLFCIVGVFVASIHNQFAHVVGNGFDAER